MYLSDYHVHTSFSFDSSQDLDILINKAIGLGLDEICITDHYDYNYPHGDDFTINFEEYFKVLNELIDKYSNEIVIRIGLELGMDLNYKDELHYILDNYQFDYIIGSIHVINDTDFYYQDYFKDKTSDQIYRLYLEQTLLCIKEFTKVNTLGHLDNIIKYVPCDYKGFDYALYQDIIDEILLELINSNRGIEINTSGMDHFNNPYPHFDIVKRYFELGGSIITIGSDSHTYKTLCNNFDIIFRFLKGIGVDKYSTFSKQEAIYHSIMVKDIELV